MTTSPTAEQNEIIDAPLDIDMQVVAGAGTGKTTTIASRIVRQINSKTIKETEIVAISFTNSAAKELKERINKILGRKSHVRATNLHKLCSGFLRDISTLFPGHSKVPAPHFEIIIPNQSKSLFSSLYELAKEDIFKRYTEEQVGLCMQPRQLHSLLSTMKAQGIDVNHDNILEKVSHSEASVYLMREYDRHCRLNNLLDFDDLICRLHDILEANTDIRNYVQKQVGCLYIDEFQDVSSVQMKLINLICGEAPLCVVGDEGQSIYGFRGADPEHFNQFHRNRPNCIRYALTYNFRSHKGILHIANLVRSAQNPTERLLLNSVTSTIQPRSLVYKTDESESVMIAEQIKALISEGYVEDDIAVLCRSNKQTDPIFKALLSKGVNAKINAHQLFWDRVVVKQALALFSLIDNPRNILSLKALLPILTGVGTKTYLDVVKKLENNLTSSCIEELFFVNTTPANHLKMLLDTINSVTEADGLLGAFIYLAKHPNFFTTQSDLLDEDKDLLEVLAAYVESSKATSWRDLLENISLSSDQPSISKGQVTLCTIHASKGREFKVVIVAGANTGLIPHPRAHGKALNEERRLLYVALTRAKELLYVSYKKGCLTPFLTAYTTAFQDWTLSFGDTGEFTSSASSEMSRTGNELKTLTEKRGAATASASKEELLLEEQSSKSRKDSKVGRLKKDGRSIAFTIKATKKTKASAKKLSHQDISI